MGNKYSICESCLTSSKSPCSTCRDFWQIFNNNNRLIATYSNKSNRELFSNNPFTRNAFKYTPEEVLYLYCYNKPGSYWYLDSIGLNNVPFTDIANPDKKNKPIFYLAIPKGIFFITGNMKERKYYIPGIVVESLLPYSDDFLYSRRNKGSLESFIKASKLTFIIQDMWWMDR